MFDITSAIKAIGDGIKGIFDFASTAKNHQAETEVIKEKRDLKKATNKAEEAFKIVFRNFECLPEKEQERFKKLYDDFLDYN